jgi:hypothetical protein
MKMKMRRIGFSLLVGIAWTAIPFLISRVSALEGLAYLMAWPGTVASDDLLGKSIHDTIWFIPIAIIANLLIAGGVVYIITWLFSSLGGRKARGTASLM